MSSLAACSPLPLPTGPVSDVAVGERFEEVVDLMQARRASGYVPGSHSDGHHLCLAVQGGGMRGVIGAAAAVGLDQLGFAGTFDTMVGTSAGGLTVAYLAAGQIAEGTSIYYQNLAGHEHFIDRWRLSAPMDIHFLYDQWVTRGKALDVDGVLRSRTRVVVTTTAVETGVTRLFDNRELSGPEFVAALRASTSMPIYASNREMIRGTAYSDGYVDAALPVRQALDYDCSHLVVLPTALPHELKTPGLIERVYAWLRLQSYPTPFVRAVQRRRESYIATVGPLYGEGFGLPTLVLPPTDPATVPSNRETDPAVLVTAAEAALRRVEQAFGAPAGSTSLYFAPEGQQAFASPGTTASIE